MSAVLWGGLVAWLGVGDPAVPRDPGGRRLLAARGRQLHGALRHAAPEGRDGRAPALRAGRPQPQLELQQHRDQRAALPPAAAQRPPRQPDPSLPDAARLRGVPGAADRVRRHDRARHRARRLAPGDGPARRRPLRRRPDAAPTSARASARRCSRKYAARPSSARQLGPTASDGPTRGGGARRPLSRAAATPTRSRPATSTRASRPARRGRTSPTTGAAPTAASAKGRLRPASKGRSAEHPAPPWRPLTRRPPVATRDRHRRRGGPAHHLVGLGTVTMSRLADGVGVSRQTVYNEVGTKPALAEAMILASLTRSCRWSSRRSTRTPTTCPGDRAVGVGCSSSRGPTSCCTRWCAPPTAPTPSCSPLLTTHAESLLAAAKGWWLERVSAVRRPARPRPPRARHRHGRPGRAQPRDAAVASPARTGTDIAWLAARVLR